MKCNQKTKINNLKRFLTKKEDSIQNNTLSLQRISRKEISNLIINIIH